MTFPEASWISEFEAAGIRVIPYHPTKKYSRKDISIVRKELLDGKYDILHLFNSTAIVNGLIAARQLPVKVILYRGTAVNVHWYDPLAYFKFLSPRADKIICLSDGVKRALDRNLLFSKNKTITILKGHLPEWYDPGKKADLSQLGIPPGSFTVVSVGNVRRVKGIPYLIRAANHLPEGLPIHFLLIGRDMDTPDHLALIEQMPYKDHFHIAGPLKNPHPYVAASQVFVLASLGAEAITKSVIEAMSLEVAPVITNIFGNKDLVVDGENGLLVPVKDSKAIAEAILTLYHDPALRQLYAKRSRERIRTHLHSDQTVRNYYTLYQDLLAKKK